jgi:Polyketide cyclase / dehydrase and lipid transport
MKWAIGILVLASGCAASTAARSCRDTSVWSTNTVSVDIDAPLDEVYAFVVAEDAPNKLLRRYGPVPAPKESHIIDGPWERVGARRKVVLDNGGTLVEEVTAYDRPALYAYRIDDFHFFVKGLSSSGTGVWQFYRTAAGKTRVVWTYSFEPRSRGTRSLLDLGMSWFYRPYMRRGLEEAKHLLEQAKVTGR